MGNYYVLLHLLPEETWQIRCCYFCFPANTEPPFSQLQVLPIMSTVRVTYGANSCWVDGREVLRGSANTARATGPLRPKCMNLSLAMAPMVHIHSQLSPGDKKAQAHSYLQTSYPSISNMEKAIEIRTITSDIFRLEYPIAKGLP